MIEAPLSPAEVAELFSVDPKTVTRWARAGWLPHFRTPGGHRRYHVADVQALLDNGRHNSTEGSH